MSDQKDVSFKELIPYLGSFIILLGITRQLFYYGSFGIAINNYLEFSEIITSFLDILVIVIIVFAISVIQGFLQRSKREHQEKKALYEKILNEDSFFKRVKLYTSYYSTYIFTAIANLIIYFIWHFFDKAITGDTFLFLSLWFLGAFIFLIIILEIDVKHKHFNSSTTEKLFILSLLNGIFFLALTLMYTNTQVVSVKEKKVTYGTKIIFNDNRQLLSDSSNYFIGKTQNYIFYYHEITNTTDVFPASDIKQLSFGGKKNSR